MKQFGFTKRRGDNPTIRQIGGGKYQQRGVELLMEFRLVEASSGQLLWKYRVHRFGKDADEATWMTAQALFRVWPFRAYTLPTQQP